MTTKTLYSDIMAMPNFEGMSKEEYLVEIASELEQRDEDCTPEQRFKQLLDEGFIFEMDQDGGYNE